VIQRERFEAMLDEYYQVRGWTGTGCPPPASWRAGLERYAALAPKAGPRGPPMRVRVELLGLFRQKAGTDRLEVQLDAAAGRARGSGAGRGVARGSGQGAFRNRPLQSSRPTGTLRQHPLGPPVPAGGGGLPRERVAGGGRPPARGSVGFPQAPRRRRSPGVPSAEEQVAEGQSVVLSTAMGGG